MIGGTSTFSGIIEVCAGRTIDLGVDPAGVYFDDSTKLQRIGPALDPNGAPPAEPPLTPRGIASRSA